VNQERITRAVEVIRELIDRGVTDEPDEIDSAEALNMNTWGRQNDCGTSACLAGWMTLDPQLREMGLRNRKDFHPSYTDSLEPRFQEAKGGEALVKFFYITHDEMRYIFGGDNPNSLEKGLSRLERVARGEYDPRQEYADERREEEA
jgi:hypothetical protein